MAALIERGDRVLVLGRSTAGVPLEERIALLLAWFGLEELADRVETAEVDLLKPGLGLEPARYAELCNRPRRIVHLASDTRFARAHEIESLETNVLSLNEVIEFAKSSRAPFFHYVSTAYVAGLSGSRCLEEPVQREDFANIYEATKARAEAEVATRCGALGVPFSILRPSIVYGDSASGRSNSFTALYHHVKALHLIRGIYLDDIGSHGGARASACGIRLDAHGLLHLPLRIFLAHRGHLNLIPIDYFTAAALKILDEARPGLIYHVTSTNPSTMEELASFCERFLNLKGIEIRYGDPPEGFRQNPAESLFNKLIEPYRPYLNDTRRFDRSNLDALAPGSLPPRLDYPIFERCMAYAVGVNWGSRE